MSEISTAGKSIDVTQASGGPWPAEGLERVDCCPVCNGNRCYRLYEGLTDRVYRFAPGEWTVYRCRDCGSGYLNPRPTRETIARAYRKYYTHDSAADTLATTGNGLAQLIRRSLRNGYLNDRYNTRLKPAHVFGRHLVPLIPPLVHRADRSVRHLLPPTPGCRLLDVGCGNGEFLATMSESGWTVCGLEPDPAAAKVARRSVPSVIQGTLDDNTFPGETFDAITLHHVIEHLHDPLQTLRICRNILRPGGIISVITPNFGSSGSALFKSNWYALNPPYHLILFTAKSLRGALEGAGFQTPVAHRSSFVAQSMFRASSQLAEGSGEVLPGAWRWRMQSIFANLMVYLRSDRSEEVIMTARKGI